jgi:hypothetical protein
VDVGEMQTKLSRWAEQDKARCFEDLFNLLYDGNWLRTAQVHVRQKKAGIPWRIFGFYTGNHVIG